MTVSRPQAEIFYLSFLSHMSEGKIVQTNKGFIAGNKVQLVRGGKAYFDLLLEMIETAKEIVHLQTYIYDEDETGRMIADALIRAAQRGVKVFLIADGYASKNLSRDFIATMEAGGIQFRFFEPVFRSSKFYFGRRLHHKVVVSDRRRAMVAGINISNRYNDMPDKPAWLDFAAYAEGNIAEQLQVLCEKTWNGYRQLHPFAEKPTPFYPLTPTHAKDCLVRMRRNDWVRRKNQISASYLSLFRNAKKEIILLGSYFLPGQHIRKALADAAARGVHIRVVVAGPSDVMMAKHAERYMYSWMLEKGIEIYEYQHNVLHGKIAVCDEHFTTIGSYNINNISAYASIELNLDIQDHDFAQHTKAVLEAIIARQCKRVTYEDFVEDIGWTARLQRWAAYTLFRIVFFLFTFYFKQTDLR